MLPKTPDRRKIYYKITNQKENHHGLRYHDGLIIDLKRFNNNPENSCVKGGIYFTTEEYLHKFFEYGCWIRPIKIPLDAKVILDSTGDKYRADKLFFQPRKSFNFYFNKLFNKKTFPKEYYLYLAEYYSKYLDIWFNEETFPKEHYWYLAEYCSKYFDVWFNKKTFPEKEYWCLAEYCSKYFDVWFNKETFPDKECWRLAEYRSDRFTEWFNKKTFPKKYYWCLAEYCQKYKHIWNK